MKESAPSRTSSVVSMARDDNMARKEARAPGWGAQYHRASMKIFGFAGYSGSGKTTLIERLIPLFTERGIRVSLIKHAHHTFDVDQPGKDSYRHRKAGCTEVLVTSSRRWALVHELRGASEPTLADQVKRMSPCDLLLVEGYKREPIPKLEVHRAATGESLLY